MLLLEFLEKPKNFDLIVGKATKGKGVVGGQGLTKAHGYKLMATYINKNLREDVLRDWTGANAKGRFGSYMRAFKAALKWEGGRDGGQSGEGLTEKDFANGMCLYNTVDKLENMCFGYERMKAMFSGRQNIQPSHVSEVGRYANLGNEDTEELKNNDDENDDGGVSSDNGGVNMVLRIEHESEQNYCNDDNDSSHDNDENDPNQAYYSDAYWRANDAEDAQMSEPASTWKQTANPTLGAENSRVSTRELPRATSTHALKKKSIPQTFPVSRKPPSSKKDFVTAYAEGQSKMLELELKKFEFMKLDQTRQARANFISELLRQGQSRENIEYAVKLAYGELE
ncbi:hypothetical protein AC1031_014486 [Aphanomyces cochlioides]|nr:hypothetical protein AC1031_014486 [Aphanomyces cochlioides]